ncbi:Protein draper, partial [Araneus ventricosus]
MAQATVRIIPPCLSVRGKINEPAAANSNCGLSGECIISPIMNGTCDILQTTHHLRWALKRNIAIIAATREARTCYLYSKFLLYLRCPPGIGGLDHIYLSLWAELPVHHFGYIPLRKTFPPACPPGWFGERCSGRCNCLNAGQCAPDTGKCKCPSGYAGKHCEQACPKGSYGMNCSERCDCGDHPCHPASGTCLCPPGFTGQRCHL